MGDSSQQKLIKNGGNLATAQTVPELNHDVNSNGACDEKVLENRKEKHKSINGGSPILGGLDATQGNETNEVSTPVKQSKGRPRKTERKVIGSPRVLRSRSQEKPKAPESVEVPLQEVESKEKKRRKKVKKIKKDHNDEFSKITRHLRYLIHRMAYEQNFIEAYAGEGWKGLSLEKLRPEKELERAKSAINGYKLKIRDLFQRIDKSCEEGRIPETLYDSEGLIDSEDIFCSKCGQTEVHLDNDIILCDGVCERGFHQFCLDPPLLKEQVPPGDEGWLCPACDCKIDCFDMLNDSQGTNLSVTDSWEKVFPETATFGNRLDDNSGLPSDDSEDDDYDPDGPEVEEEADAEEADAEDSSSDESDFSSASEDLVAVANNDPLLALPSDDSEDDDFNPDKVDSDKEAKSKSSSSDFTSDFDDLGDINKNEVTSDEVQEPAVPAAEEEIPKTSMEDDDSGPITAKRRVERLDYKKLHDETYGNVSSDTSDEDFSDSEAPKRRKNANGAKGMEVNEKMEQNESTPVSRTGKQLDAEGTSSSPAIKGSSDKSGTRSSYKRLGQAVTQRLYESFQENQYPHVDARENLAKELNLTQTQVRKWFENARWSFNHHGKNGKAGKSPALIPKQVNVSSSNTPKSRKRKTNADQHDTETTPSLKEASPMDSSNQTTRRSGRVQAKKLASVP